MNTPFHLSKTANCSFCSLLLMISALYCNVAHAEPEVTACKLKVFSIDPDTRGSNIRSGPGSEHKVLATIKDSDSQMEITGSAGKWLRVRQVSGVGGEMYFKGEGWVFAPLTGINARASVSLRASPTAQSAMTGKIPADAGASVQSCNGEWLEIQYKNTKGWMQPGSYCGNPVTTCS
ncbi:SH3 domain-containing protein [Undibacterium sp. Ji83W]|uniref:SH3 domain-containing protein n=1 Tax=Undibacterium sp. Ji83W TaxID=3413043 RepID=UPI003BF41399